MFTLSCHFLKIVCIFGNKMKAWCHLTFDILFKFSECFHIKSVRNGKVRVTVYYLRNWHRKVKELTKFIKFIIEIITGVLNT